LHDDPSEAATEAGVEAAVTEAGVEAAVTEAAEAAINESWPSQSGSSVSVATLDDSKNSICRVSNVRGSQTTSKPIFANALRRYPMYAYWRTNESLLAFKKAHSASRLANHTVGLVATIDDVSLDASGSQKRSGQNS
jgi:hypothetical protein